MNQKEVWKDVKNYGGYYQVSNLGRVKSLKAYKTIILKPSKSGGGYYAVSLSVKGLKKTRHVHQLVAESFLDHVPCGIKKIIDHIDNNPLNNNVLNLQIISQRQNTSKRTRGTSKYTGVCWDKTSCKWMSYINIGGKRKHLGRFTSEIQASNAYKSYLKTV